MKIKFKISALVLACTIISALAISILSFTFSNKIISDDASEIINSSCEKTAFELDAYFMRIEQSVDTLADYIIDNLNDFETFKRSDAYVDEFSEMVAPSLLSAAEHTEGAISVYIRYSPDVAYPTSGKFYMRNGLNAPYEVVENTDFSIYDKTDLNHVGWYYIPVNNGKPTWMAPYLNENVGVYMISYVIPLFINGENLGIIGMDVDFSLIEELADIKMIYESASAFVLGDENQILFHKEVEYGTMLADLDSNGGTNAIGAAISSGNVSREIFEMKYDGQSYVTTFRPLRNGMNLMVAVTSAEMNAQGAGLRVSIIIAAIVVVILAGVVALIIVSSISRPIASLNRTAQQIAEGNLDAEINVKSKDEIGMLAENFSHTVTRLHDYVEYISEISFVLDEISRGNLDFKLTKEYIGNFAKVKDSLENISDTLSKTMYDINAVAKQVAISSEHVSSGAQSLAQSSTQQTTSITELSRSIDILTEDVALSTENIHKAFLSMEAAFNGIRESSKDMSDMHSAMDAISDASEKISNIVKTVEDIAFQTNILSLNASIEAARAGEAGKGFAVVAQEIQMLSSKTAASTGNINELVENVMSSVKNGRDISIKADNSLKHVASTAEIVKSSLQDISESSNKQSESIEKIDVGIKQIAEAVQNNSATAEESAAASEQMSSQAQVLSDRISMFKLKD
ncbi:MAG: HAMP domain-containing protein [Oscillospiraceae bacterium]|nr:HAMP domain-containing protein [Oscillospiraceae bacterium]